MGNLGNSMDLPFEPTTGRLEDEHVHFSGGLVLMASTIDVPEVGLSPSLVFRFALPDGTGFYPPTVLVMDDDQMAKLTTLVEQAVATARAAASS